MNYKSIAIFVTAVHCGLIGSAIFWTPSKTLAKKKTFIAKTVKLQPPKVVQERQVVAKKEEAKPEVKKETSKPVVKKEEPKPAVAKKEEPKPAVKKESVKPKVEKKAPPKKVVSEEMIAKARENLAKIEKKPSKVSAEKTSVAIPKAIQQKGAAPVKIAQEEGGYREELINRLKLLLRLPEYGCVTVELTLGRKGQVKQLVVVSAESERNRIYVEKTLPSLTFSDFGSNFLGASNHTFLLELSNEW